MNQTMPSMSKPSIFLTTFLIGFIFLGGFRPAVSQEVYGLNRCIETSLDRNFGLKVIRNRETISANNFTVGNAGMLPTVTATSRYSGTLNTTNQNLAEGGQLSTVNTYNTSASAAVNLGMTIFRGFHVQNTYKKLGAQNELGGLNTQMAIENLVASVVSEYNYYLQQLILYNNLSYAVALSRERVRIDEQRYLLGSGSKLQLLQSIVYLNADSSRYARQNEVLKASQIRLNELMASENLGAGILLADTVILLDKDLLLNDLTDQTMRLNTVLQIAAKNKEITNLDYKIIASRSYPYLTLASGYSYSYNSYETGTVYNQNMRGLNYGVTLGIDIFDGFNRNRERTNARIEMENRNVQFQEVEQQVKADLLTIYYAYENNLKLLKLEEQNLEVARENLEIAMERYKLGNLAGLELREVQKSLLDAEERLVSVQYQTKLAEISLMQISGKIMDYVE